MRRPCSLLIVIAPSLLACGQKSIRNSPSPPLSLLTDHERSVRSLIVSAGGHISNQIHLFESSQKGGIGVRASSAVPSDVELVRVPASVQLSGGVPTSIGCDFPGAVEWEGRLSPLGFTSLCLLTLLYGVGRDVSFRREGYEGYLSLLPDGTPNSVYYDNETASVTGYRPFVDHAEEVRDEVHKVLEDVRAGCDDAGEESWNGCLGIDPKVNARNKLLDSVSVAMSRGFGTTVATSSDHRSSGEKMLSSSYLSPHVLSPFDFFNHGNSVEGRNARYAFDDSDGALVFESTREIAVGEEIRITYGSSLSPIVSVTQYGFLPEAGVEDMEVSLEPCGDDPNGRIKALILSELRLDRGTMRKGLQITRELMMALRLLSMSPDELSAYNIARILDGQSIGSENDIRSLFRLRDSCAIHAERWKVRIPNIRVGGSSREREALDLVLRYRDSLLNVAEDCAEHSFWNSLE